MKYFLVIEGSVSLLVPLISLPGINKPIAIKNKKKQKE